MLAQKSQHKKVNRSFLFLFIAFIAIMSVAFTLNVFAASSSPNKEAEASTATTLAEYDFEDGTAMGWYQRGDGSAITTTEEAYSGTYSLKTSGRTVNWHGPARDVLSLLQKDGVYEISAYVRLPAGITATQISLTMLRTPDGGSDEYDLIASSSSVTNTGWVLIQGSYTFDTDVTGLTLYLESPELVDFYVDEVVITEISPPPSATLLDHDFEDGTTMGWYQRGSGEVTATMETTAYEGSYSLKTSGRTANWNGPARDVLSLLQKDGVYDISAYVKLPAGITATQIGLTMLRTPDGGSDEYDLIASSSSVTNTGWVLIQGSYSFATDVTGLTLYLESPELVDFYVDKVVITEVSPPPPPDLLDHDFEDGTTMGWYQRGAGGVTATTEVAYEGIYSLKTYSRTANWNGPARDVLSLLQRDGVYEISAYVRLAAGEPDSQIILAMERTSDGDTAYEWVAPSASDGVTDTGWVLLQGQYSFTNTNTTALNLYLESPNLVDFYVDKVVITEISAPPTQINTGFESGTTEGWKPRIGSELLTVTMDTAHGGDYSLLISNRAENHEGPSLDILNDVATGVRHEVSVWVKLAPGAPPTNIRVSVESRQDGTPDYKTVIGSTAVSTTEWINLAGSYSLNQNVDFLEIYVESSSSLASFYMDDFSFIATQDPPIQTDIPSVYETLAPYFPVGAALEPDQLGSSRHAQLFNIHFNSLTPENAMKPGPIHPEEAVYNWDGADALVAYADANGQMVHGHVLVWHSQTANWMFENASGVPLTPTVENKALMLTRMEDHIRAVAGRYKDDIDVWDVVNEVIDPNEADCMRKSPWFELTGTDYISTAFHIAHDVVPTATLIINDYSTTNPQKRECLYNLVDEMLAAGVPIEGIGMQLHVNIQNPSASTIAETIDRFASLGVEVHITELDMSIYTNDTDSYDTVPEEIMVRQGYRYKDIFEVLRDKSDDIGSVTFWGMGDDHTWLSTFPIARINLPLLFDEQLQAKYAYWGVISPTLLPILTQQINTPAGVPVIDGQPETLWNMLPWINIPGNESFSANFQTRWDEDSLYLFVDVDDATQDVDDMVEIFVDENNDKGTAYDANDTHYVYANGVISPAVPFSATTKSGGYRLEIQLPLSATASLDQEIGFDLRITDGSQPENPISWNDLSHDQENTPANFGTLTLIEELKLTIAKTGTPTIDGNLDNIWATAEEFTTDVWAEGTEGATATVKTLWDNDHLYVYAIVHDVLVTDTSSNSWEQDSIEVFVDQNNGKTDSYEADDGQYRINFNNEQSFGGAAASTATLTSSAMLTTGGYIVELAITLNDVQPANGVMVGFDFQVNNDENGDGSRDSVSMWHDPTGLSYQNMSRLGVLRFQADIYLPIIMK